MPEESRYVSDVAVLFQLRDKFDISLPLVPV